MSAPPIALITGITGQDGSYLAELLLQKGYIVHGVVRRSSNFHPERIDHLYVDQHQSPRLFLHYGDLQDGVGLRRLVEQVRPGEVYNLGAQSHVRVSFDQPEFSADVVGLGVLRLLEAVRAYQDASGVKVRFYQAGSSEMFGSAKPRQHEGTRFEPRSPYACDLPAARGPCGRRPEGQTAALGRQARARCAGAHRRPGDAARPARGPDR